MIDASPHDADQKRLLRSTPSHTARDDEDGDGGGRSGARRLSLKVCAV